MNTMITSCSELMSFSYPEKSFLEDNLLDADDWGEENINLGIWEDGNISTNSSSPSSDNPELQFIPDYSSVTSLQYECLDSFLSNSKLLCVTEVDSLENGKQATIPCSQEKCNKKIPVTNNNSIPISKNSIISTLTQTVNNNPSKNISQPNSVQSRKSTSNYLQQTNKNTHSLQDSLKIKVQKPILIKKEPERSKVVSAPNIYPLPIPTMAPAIVKLENGNYFVAKSFTNQENGNKKPNKKGRKKKSEVCIESIHTISSNVNDLKKYKRQQRMAKNRESACLSRQRKKEHLSMLESQVSMLSGMNEQLREENETLKQRIKSLENELFDMKKKSSDNFKKSSVLFVIVFIFIFNINSSWNSFDSAQDGDKTIDMSYHNELSKQVNFHSRSLLHHVDPKFRSDGMKLEYYLQPHQKPYNSNLMDNFVSVNNRNRNNRKMTGYKRSQNTTKIRSSHEMQDSTDCGEHLNETYIKRINNALNGLVKGLRKEPDKKKYKPAKKWPKAKKFDAIVANTSITKIHKGKTDNCTHHKHRHRSTLFFRNFKIDKYRKNLSAEKDGLFNLTSQELANVIQKAINRKPDTFYVVTSPKDFLTILPSTNNSNIRRPKVSFMIPIFHPKSNDTLEDTNRLSLLKIDCKVIDTSLLQLDRNVVFRSLLTGL